MSGIRPSCTNTFVSSGDVLVLHGSFDGYIHRQEKGNTFDGVTILGRYRSPDLSFGDSGVRKHMQRVIINYKPESSIDANLFVRYDNESVDSAWPDAYPLDSAQVAAQYGTTAVYSTASDTTQFVYGGSTQPLVRQSVEGSGFTVTLRVDDDGETAPYSIKGFQLEYQLGARR